MRLRVSAIQGFGEGQSRCAFSDPLGAEKEKRMPHLILNHRSTEQTYRSILGYDINEGHKEYYTALCENCPYSLRESAILYGLASQ